MTTDTRHERRAANLADRRAQRQETRASARQGASTARKLAFGGVVLGVLAIGAYLSLGVFVNRPSATGDQISIQSSMAGFTPSTITVTAGTTVTFNWWTQDAAMHLTNGYHTMIAPDLGLDEQLPADSSRLVRWTVPDKPGTYDVYCDSCCGGKDNPVMHGKIVIVPSTAGRPAEMAA